MNHIASQDKPSLFKERIEKGEFGNAFDHGINCVARSRRQGEGTRLAGKGTVSRKAVTEIFSLAQKRPCS